MKGIKKCDILIPKENIDLYKYSCVACDQFTGDPEYWHNAEKIAENAPSTLDMIFPEIYLSDDNSSRTKRINEKMHENQNIFREIKDSVIYVERTLFSGRVRKGVVVACDLEEYDYSKNTHSLIRPTEGTIEERLPARVAIRENAPLELPHIMLLVNDEKMSVEKIINETEKTHLYSTELMLSGGKIDGYGISGENADKIIEALCSVDCGENDNVIRFAVGDGNHSLATAKKCWENIKKTLSEEEKKTHPARYALCEIVNLHDPALDFEPIHRVMYNTDVENLFKELEAHSAKDGQKIVVVFGNEEKEITLAPTHTLAVGTLQNILDGYLKKTDAKIDYVHEPEQVRTLAKEKNTVGLLVTGLNKSELFPAVLKNGALPRKTFSMGMGIDKRYYFEARKIR